MLESETFTVRFCFFLVTVVAGTLLGPMLLRFAVYLYNKMAGLDSCDGVREPEFLKALAITILAALIELVSGFLLGGMLGTSAGATQHQAANLARILSIPIGVFALTAFLVMTLPTSFGRAFLVSLLYLVMSIVIVSTLLIFVIMSVAR